ncbi:cellular retinoic acid-binding protein 1-like [Aphidius gifuensis]|uniref:cellular retinoic acid-binding protein 1-like n=1 Tax=Aphidius gifuensis TaxID=684658 RepID=UPI001CDB49B6|nr:cellular retinoic acid-binding protein 1-like [Aphidius gifuensis]
MSFSGTFIYERSEGLEQLVAKIGGPGAVENFKIFHRTRPHVRATRSGDSFTYTFYMCDDNIINTFKIGEEFKETTYFKDVAQSVVTISGDNIMYVVSKLENGNSFNREIIFSPEGSIIHFTESKYGTKATSWYRRI